MSAQGIAWCLFDVSAMLQKGLLMKAKHKYFTYSETGPVWWQLRETLTKKEDHYPVEQKIKICSLQSQKTVISFSLFKINNL